jgi:serine/threonine-protein kinase
VGELATRQPTRWVIDTAFVETPSEAAKVLATMPPELMEPPPGRADLTMMHGLPSAVVGKALVLGGRPVEAMIHLQRAASKCDTLEAPLSQTQAHLWLGLALEATGKRRDACNAYELVLHRWGKTPSVSAKRADERRHALSCEK